VGAVVQVQGDVVEPQLEEGTTCAASPT